MATQPALRRWTYDELRKLPADANRYEVIAGELVVSPSPGRAHQRLVRRLTILMQPFVEAHRLGEMMQSPFDVLLAPDEVLIPDLVFVRGDRSHILTQRAVEGAPDLVIEVLSPSTRTRDRGIKRERYAHFGVPEYWMVDPVRRTVEVHRLADEGQPAVTPSTETLGWLPVPGRPTLEIDVEALFRDLD